MYLCISHSISVSKSCGGGCRKLVSCGELLWVNWFHSHCSLSVVMVVMYFPFGSYMLDSEICVWTVGLLEIIPYRGYILACMFWDWWFVEGDVCILCLLFGCVWGSPYMFGWHCVSSFYFGIGLWVGGCVLVGCCLGVVGPLLCTIVVCFLVWIAIGIGMFSWWLVRQQYIHNLDDSREWMRCGQWRGASSTNREPGLHCRQELSSFGHKRFLNRFYHFWGIDFFGLWQRGATSLERWNWDQESIRIVPLFEFKKRVSTLQMSVLDAISSNFSEARGHPMNGEHRLLVTDEPVEV